MPEVPSPDDLMAAPKWAVFALAGLVAVFLFVISLGNIVPVHASVTGRMWQVVVVVSVLIVIVGYGKMRVPFRIPSAVFFMLVIQAWLSLCTFVAFDQLGRITESDRFDYIFLMYVIFFMVGAVGSFYSSSMRGITFKLILFQACLNAFVGVLQFAKVGPAVAIARINNVGEDITNWDGIKGSVRIIGLTGLPETFAIICLTANGIFLGRLISRQLRFWEYACSFGLTALAFAAQSRVMYFSVVLTVLIELFLIIRRDPRLAVPIVAVTAIVIAGVFGVVADKLAYGLRLRSDDPSLIYRTQVAWPQAYRILDSRPVTGLGIDGRLASSGSPGQLPRTQVGVVAGDLDRWVRGMSLDSGILLMGAWGGYPGMFLFALLALLLLMSLLRVCLDRTASDSRRTAAAVALTGSIAILNNCILNNSYLQWTNVSWIAICGGMAMPGVEDIRTQLRLNQKRFLPRQAIDVGTKLPPKRQSISEPT